MLYVNYDATADRIFDSIKEAGLSQNKLAEKIGTYPQVVSRWRQGKGAPTLEQLVNIAEVLETSLDELVVSFDDGRAEDYIY